MIEATMQAIIEAAGKRDLAAVIAQARKATELEEMRKTVQEIEGKLTSLKTPAISETSEPQLNVNLRELPVEVTGGMLRQNLLTLTTQVKRGKIKVGEELTIEAFPSGERFRTDLMMNGNKLRERGAIGRFYKDAGIREGDFVVLVEVAQSRWTLKKAPLGQYQGRRDLLAMI